MKSKKINGNHYEIFRKHPTEMKNFSGKYSKIGTVMSKVDFNKVKQNRVE